MSLTQKFNLRNFPFDSQTFYVNITIGRSNPVYTSLEFNTPGVDPKVQTTFSNSLWTVRDFKIIFLFMHIF
jgi:hypothetical protein